MKVIEKVKKIHIAVENQDLDVEFCFVTPEGEDYKAISYWSVCRDFLGDVVCASTFGTTANIYGFSHDGKKDPLYEKATLLGMKFPNQESLYTFLKNLTAYKKFITTKAQTSRKTITYQIMDDGLTIVVIADKMWQKTTVGISLFSFLLKGMCWDFDETYENLFDAIAYTEVEIDSPTKEANYALKNEKLLTMLLENIKQLTDLHKYPHGYEEQEQYISTVHNTSGFYFAIRWKRDTLVGKWAAAQ
jgi:hypothetical protein